MPKFRKKSIVIEAFRWLVDEVPSWWEEKSQSFKIDTETGEVFIPALEGTVTAFPNDWIIKGVKGEFYTCKPHIFVATYEAVE